MEAVDLTEAKRHALAGGVLFPPAIDPTRRGEIKVDIGFQYRS